MKQITVTQYCKKVFGFTPISREVFNAVFIDPYICEFDFDECEVLMWYAEKKRTIAKIQRFERSFLPWKGRFLQPFVGLVQGEDWSLETRLRYFGFGMEVKLELGGKVFSHVLDVDSRFVSFIGLISIRIYLEEEKLVVDFESEAKDIAMVVSAIVYKWCDFDFNRGPA